jgi:hypothetical protein
MTDEKVLTPEQENAQRRERLGRVLAEEEAAKKLKADRVAKNDADCAAVNAEFFRKQEELSAQIAANKPVALPKQTNEDAVAATAARYPYPVTNPQPIGDHLMESQSDACKRAAGYIPPKLKPSITLQPLPAKYPASDPRAGMDEDLIVRMSMNPDPRKGPFEK